MKAIALVRNEHDNARFLRQREQLLTNLQTAHADYYRAETFGGPSLYFHQKSLEAARSLKVDRFAELVYATLASWGMHRMGKGGSKMGDFRPFYDSLVAIWPRVEALCGKRPEELGVEDWSNLQFAFSGIKCMRTATSLVGNSKVLAHALPNLVPPVDREYTLNFLYGHSGIKNDIDLEWKKLEEMLRGFFYPVATSPAFRNTVAGWMRRHDIFKWDTSELKVIDNLLIGLRKVDAAESKLPQAARRA